MKILVLGAGPAGSSCAIQLLKAGHAVSIIDRTELPRHAPGETLHPGIEPLLKQLGALDDVLNADFIRHQGIENIRNGISTYKAYNAEENWKGFQVFREEFDTLLLNKAIELGASFHSGVTPIKVNYVADSISSIETATDKFEADYFIDATGRRAWLANNFNIGFKEYSPKQIAYYGYVSDSNLRPENPQLIWDEKGWTWISQVKDNLTAWVYLNLRKHEKVKADWVPKWLADGKSTSSIKAVNVTWKKAKTCCKENCFLAGDAAFILDPGSSHGILKALMSGIMIAHLISKSDDYPNSVIENHYNQWIDSQFNDDIFILKEIYKAFQVKDTANVSTT